MFLFIFPKKDVFLFVPHSEREWGLPRKKGDGPLERT